MIDSCLHRVALAHGGGGACSNDNYEHQLHRLLLHWESRVKLWWIHNVILLVITEDKKARLCFKHVIFLWLDKQP